MRLRRLSSSSIRRMPSFVVASMSETSAGSASYREALHTYRANAGPFRLQRLQRTIPVETRQASHRIPLCRTPLSSSSCTCQDPRRPTLPLLTSHRPCSGTDMLTAVSALRSSSFDSSGSRFILLLLERPIDFDSGCFSSNHPGAAGCFGRRSRSGLADVRHWLNAHGPGPISFVELWDWWLQFRGHDEYSNDDGSSRARACPGTLRLRGGGGAVVRSPGSGIHQHAFDGGHELGASARTRPGIRPGAGVGVCTSACGRVLQLGQPGTSACYPGPCLEPRLR